VPSFSKIQISWRTWDVNWIFYKKEKCKVCQRVYYLVMLTLLNVKGARNRKPERFDCNKSTKNCIECTLHLAYLSHLTTEDYKYCWAIRVLNSTDGNEESRRGVIHNSNFSLYEMSYCESRRGEIPIINVVISHRMAARFLAAQLIDKGKFVRRRLEPFDDSDTFEENKNRSNVTRSYLTLKKWHQRCRQHNRNTQQ